MAFISSGYNPEKPMQDRITDIGPQHFSKFLPPVLAKNKGAWDYHEIIEPGIDAQTAVILGYDHGELALLSSAVRTNTPQEARILGTEGNIHIPDFWHATTATLSANGCLPAKTKSEAGYHFEAIEVGYCLRTGKQESALMPWEESLTIARIMDAVRQQIGLVYPTERK